MTPDRTPTVEEALAEALREMIRVYFGNEEFDKPGYLTVQGARKALARYDPREGAEAREREYTEPNLRTLVEDMLEDHLGHTGGCACNWCGHAIEVLARLDTAPEPVGREPVITLALCEEGRVILHPGALYRFEVVEGCEKCALLARTQEPTDASE